MGDDVLHVIFFALACNHWGTVDCVPEVSECC